MNHKICGEIQEDEYKNGELISKYFYRATKEILALQRRRLETS